MKCPRCLSELIEDKKHPGKLLCEHCKKRYSADVVTARWVSIGEKTAIAAAMAAGVKIPGTTQKQEEQVKDEPSIEEQIDPNAPDAEEAIGKIDELVGVIDSIESFADNGEEKEIGKDEEKHIESDSVAPKKGDSSDHSEKSEAESKDDSNDAQDDEVKNNHLDNDNNTTNDVDGDTDEDITVCTVKTDSNVQESKTDEDVSVVEIDESRSDSDDVDNSTTIMDLADDFVDDELLDSDDLDDDDDNDDATDIIKADAAETNVGTIGVNTSTDEDIDDIGEDELDDLLSDFVDEELIDDLIEDDFEIYETTTIEKKTLDEAETSGTSEDDEASVFETISITSLQERMSDDAPVTPSVADVLGDAAKPAKKSKKKILVVLIIILIVALGVVGGVFAYQTLQGQGEPQEAEQTGIAEEAAQNVTDNTNNTTNQAEEAALKAQEKAEEKRKAQEKAEAEKKAKEEEERKTAEEIAADPAKRQAEFDAALAKANIYANNLNLSKEGIYAQLSSDVEKFSTDAARYAADNVQADWNKNALEKARIYQKDLNMAPETIYEQLVSDVERFTPEQARYAIDNL